MGILCVFCVYDTIGNRCFEKTSFPVKPLEILHGCGQCCLRWACAFFSWSFSVMINTTIYFYVYFKTMSFRK